MISVDKKREQRTDTSIHRRLPVGAEVIPGDGVHFRVWAPLRKKVEVVIEGGMFNRDHMRCAAVELKPEEDGYFYGMIAAAGAGTLYTYRLDGGDRFPDPASRFQPQGPHGPSQVVDPSVFPWTDTAWRGVSLGGQTVYEMHIGTFTREGTWRAATALLPKVVDTGITLLEIMPIADFPGRFGWGYDGVDFFAPTRLYGTPDDFRDFVDTAHHLGLGVVLDVVYNHQGPDGCYLPQFSRDYFTNRYETEWGSAFNFDGARSGPVREFILANAGYWIDEFHLDGLRLDATQTIFDNSDENILAAITRAVRASAKDRAAVVIAENEQQNKQLVLPPDQGGFGIDAVWNDDFHHSARVALTGKTEAYYTDYRGTPQELVSALKWGYLYQGQFYRWQKKRRGTSSLWIEPAKFVIFIQNHDQIANSPHGQRIHQLTGPGRFRAVTALLLLAPATPMLFQGQEFCASSPFLYFADHKAEIAELTRKGRAAFLRQFSSLASAEMEACLPDPGDQDSFERSKLDFSERSRHAEALALHRDLLRLRRQDPVFSARRKRGIDGAVLGSESLVLRFFEEHGDDRILIVNLGRDLCCAPTPEPLLAPPQEKTWRILWSSENPRYGGNGTPSITFDENLVIPGESAIVFVPDKEN